MVVAPATPSGSVLPVLPARLRRGALEVEVGGLPLRVSVRRRASPGASETRVVLSGWAVEGEVRDTFVPVTEGVVADERHGPRDALERVVGRARPTAAGEHATASLRLDVRFAGGRRGRLTVALPAPDVVEVRVEADPAPLRLGVDVVEPGAEGRPPSALAGLGARHHHAVDHAGRLVQLGADRRYAGPSCPPALRHEGGLPQGDYAPIPFLQASGGWACWLDTAGNGTRFDASRDGVVVAPSVRARSGPLVLRLALHPVPAARLAAFARETGRPAALPAWAYGFWKSRDVHERQEAVEDDVAGCRWHGIPLDAVVVDSPWATNYNTWRPNPEQFPDFAGMVRRFLADGVRTVLWTTPWVNVDSAAGQTPPDPVSVARHRGPAETYAAGVASGAFLTGPDGAPLVARWWMGRGSMVDFSGPGEAWWRAQAEAVLALGVRGIKADDGEGYYVPDDARFAGAHAPGVAPGATSDALLTSGALAASDPAPAVLAEPTGDAPGNALAPAADDGRGATRAWRWGDEYRRSMQRALDRTHPGDGVVFGRSAWSGQQATGILWGGDQASDFWALRALVAATISAAHAGVSNWSHDVGGYLGGGDGRCDPELLVRWAQLGVVTPLMQAHGHHEQEPWAYDARTLELVRGCVLLHEMLSPHVRAAARTATRTGLPIVRPLALLDPADPALWRVADAFAYGPGLLAAPVLDAGARSRTVRLPRGRWVRTWDGGVETGGVVVELDAPLERLPLLVREGTIVVTHPAEHVARGLGDVPDAERPYVATLWGAPACGRAAARLPDGAVVRWRAGRWELPAGRDVRTVVR